MRPTITKVLVPTDFSAPSDAALEFAKVIAERFGASLHLLHVYDDPLITGAFGVEGYTPIPEGTRAAVIEDASSRLALRLSPDETMRFGGTKDILPGACAPTIVDYARDRAIDLIVMGTHGRTGVAHLLMGSVAERVVRSAHCPVLTVHEDGTIARQSEAAEPAEIPFHQWHHDPPHVCPVA